MLKTLASYAIRAAIAVFAVFVLRAYGPLLLSGIGFPAVPSGVSAFFWLAIALLALAYVFVGKWPRFEE